MPSPVGGLTVPGALDELRHRFAARETSIHAFVDEPGRFDRLFGKVDELASAPLHLPLHGLALGVKDIFQVRGLPTRAGSRLPLELLQGEEAVAVSRLVAAGAVVVGKTVTTEFAYFGPGPTRNPRHLEHTPGGSSSGSAAAVAAGLADVALGTQTIGSICRPAAYCGVLGFKPSYDRVSRTGVVPLSPSLDHVGVFARDVAAVRTVLVELVADWRRDVQMSRRPRLGIPLGPYLEHSTVEGRRHFDSVCRRLEAAGFEICEVSAMSDFESIAQRHRRLVAAEAAAVHREWYAKHRPLYHPKTVELIELGRTIEESETVAARAGRLTLRAALLDLMGRDGIDLWIAPAAPGPAPFGLASTGDPVMNLPWTHAGLPAMSLPVGADSNGLPLGLQLIGGWQRDEELLAGASQIEQALTQCVEAPVR